jgi:hypothetical protein
MKNKAAQEKMNILTEDEISQHSGRGTHQVVQTMCRLTIPAREAILAAGGKIGPAYNGCWETPKDLYSVLLAIAPAGLVYCQTPADWDPEGHLTSALRMANEPQYPGESHAKVLA